MGLNELIVRKSANVTVTDQNNVLLPAIQTVRYCPVDDARYSFECNLNDDIEVDMVESDRVYENDEFVDADFDSFVSDRDHSYFIVAAASGIITGLFSELKLSEENIEKINEWKDKDWDNYILIAAKMSGYKKTDIKGAKTFLKNRFVVVIDEELKKEVKEGFAEWLKYMSSHPSIVGLAFSAFTQYSGEKYRIGDNGIEKEEVPEYYAIGRNNVEKLVYAVLYWAFYLIADTVVSKVPLLEEMKMPKEVVKMIKELSKLPLFKNIPLDYQAAEKKYSEWLKTTFEKSQYTDEDGNNRAFDLKEVISSLEKRAFSESVPVIINECIVRAFYFIKGFINEVKTKDIKTLDELNKVDLNNVLPFNNRCVSRMILVSSACFVGVNLGGAVLKAIVKQCKNGEDFKKTLLAEINVAGVGRFVFACIADSKYWSEDLKVYLQRKDKRRKADESKVEETIVEDMVSNDAFNVLSLNPVQTRLLYSIEALIVARDIEDTKDENVKQSKIKWFDVWRTRILTGLELDSEEYFVKDEKKLYDSLYALEQNADNLRWFYLVATELVVFAPYAPLGTADDGEYKKLKQEKDGYIEKEFIRRQTIATQDEIDVIRECYKKYKGVVSGSVQNTIIAAGVAGAAALLTGGLAFAFAPGIATLIAGEAVVGLHGAALTSASLAFVGGGSLAAGGLGMAGGTAIITGGGALLGIAGSGSASMAAIMMQTSSEYWVRQTTKLLTFCKCVLKERLNDTSAIKGLIEVITQTTDKVGQNINELESEDCSLDKGAIKNSKECQKYLGKCKTELEKLLAD